MPDSDVLTARQWVSLLSGRDSTHTQALPHAGIASAVLADGPHGVRFPVAGAAQLNLAGIEESTCFPPAVTLASSWDEELVAEVGRAIGTEASAFGVDVVLGPGLNVKRHPLCGRNFEYFSEDPLLSGRLAAAMVTGIEATGVGACIKHFAVNNQESHRMVVDAIVDERTLRELYLAAFEHVVTTARPRAVMAAYNRVNGTYATENHHLLTEILRREWGFGGVVMSDWGATNDRVAALEAGMDLEMPGSKGLFDQEVLGAVAGGRLSHAVVETSAQRVLDLASTPKNKRDLPVDEHDALARRVAAESTVLLTNDGLLPLQPGLSVAVIGAFADQPRYQGSGSSAVRPTRITTLLEELQRREVHVTHARGYHPTDSVHDPALITEAAMAAAAADVAVVLVGLPSAWESEGCDRSDLRLPRQHDDLVAVVTAANPRTVVALSNGAPVAMPWKDAPAAIVESYLGGQAGGAALADVLYGDVEPSGRLAETFPATLSDVAADPYFPGSAHQVQYREGLFVGYRHHTTADHPPLFAFGHGLSYTTFDWTDVAADHLAITAGDDVTLSVRVTNTGQRPGSDVLQLYLHDRTGVVLRPRRELAGFAKIRLQPGESRVVTIALPGRQFAFYDVDSEDWQIPSGDFDVEVARSSADVVATVTVAITGGVDRASEDPHTPAIAVSDAQFQKRLRRPIPPARPDRPFTRNSTMGEIGVTRGGRLLTAALRRALPIDAETSADPAVMALWDSVIREAPLRSAAIFSGGILRLPAVDALVDVLNGRPLRAAHRAVRALGTSLRSCMAAADSPRTADLRTERTAR